MLLHSNQILVPDSEPRISIYRGPNVVSAPLTGAEVRFHSNTFSNPNLFD
jgi:hypothetical protein